MWVKSQQIENFNKKESITGLRIILFVSVIDHDIDIDIDIDIGIVTG